ncbi:hypothetical protein CMV_023577 [Castanea mollissima]|uniref:Uncharacterized protein n=1 Tax=Castanea mollissima TaxID=60419 RepID=A0A8J4QKL0_9ROSI|nr:hypothetical protein CMV_023577 [Castanea mollissima]
MTNTIQKKFKVSSTQLLYQSCPYQAGTLLISGPFLDELLTDQNHISCDWKDIPSHLSGILIALIGMVLYSYFCTREGQQKANETAAQPFQVVEGESDPLLNAENGKGGLTDVVVPKAPVWNSNKDLHA